MYKRLIAIGILFPALSIAGEVEILGARATPSGPDRYRFDVTLRHQDSGWDHYADGWELLTTDGKPLGSRTLYHPHVNEQPFTRSLDGVEIPGDIDVVVIRAHDKVHGYTKQDFRLQLHHSGK